MTRLPRRALARLAASACALALVFLVIGQAHARGRNLPMTDDSGRAAGAVGRAFGGAADLVREAFRWEGRGKFTSEPGPWCADAVSAWLRQVGRRPLANRLAASALAYGPHVRDPRPGDLVVMSTRAGYAHHVGVFVGWARGGVEIVSGNWSHRVARAVVARGSIDAFVRV